jgi:hypothetical protein
MKGELKIVLDPDCETKVSEMAFRIVKRGGNMAKRKKGGGHPCK